MLKLFKIGTILIFTLFATVVFAENQVDGFRGTKWGSKLDSVNKKLEKVSSLGTDLFNFKKFERIYFSREENNTSFGKAQLSMLYYVFDGNDKLFRVSGSVINDNVRLLVEELKRMYGEPGKEMNISRTEFTSHKRYFWLGKTVVILDLTEGTGRFPFFSANFDLLDGSTQFSKDHLTEKRF